MGRDLLSDFVQVAGLLLTILGYLIVALMHIWYPKQFGGWIVVFSVPHPDAKDYAIQRIGWYMLLVPMLLFLIGFVYFKITG
jgi:hypothetical protein